MALRSSVQARLDRLVLVQRMSPFNPRPKTIELLTGLPHSVVNGLIDSERLRTGRLPCANEWYHTATLLERVEASILASLYQRNRDSGYPVAEALIEAYEGLRDHLPNGALITFDRAFFLMAQLEPGTYPGFKEKLLSLVTCPTCGCRHLVQYGAPQAEDGCVFCRFIGRYHLDSRLRAHFEPRRTSRSESSESRSSVPAQ